MVGSEGEKGREGRRWGRPWCKGRRRMGERGGRKLERESRIKEKRVKIKRAKYEERQREKKI